MNKVPDTFAALDLGSNTFRLMIADKEYGVGNQPFMDNKKVWQEIPRLSEGLAPGGPFGKEPLKRAFSALDSFHSHILKYKPKRVLAGATMAARLSGEGPWFAEELRKRYGWDAKILSGAEEAFYTARGVLEVLSEDGGGGEDSLIFDIGGRSTEFICIKGKNFVKSVSLPMGVVLLTEEYLRNDPPEPSELRDLQERCLKELESAAFSHESLSFRLVGTAGTVTTIASMLLGLEKYEPLKVNGAKIDREPILNLLHILSQETVSQRTERKGLHPRRADLILAGLALTISILDFYGKDSLTVSDDGLLEGLWLLCAGFDP
jgi:exopolyphosphatase/guanosine-5'-triphosphate,3'-diphosphate pyrophosphatase